MSILTRAEVDQMIRERLAADPAFREAMIADPRAVVSDLIGAELPDVVTVTVHEESLTDVHLVIPAATGEEIAEEDLELVTGGVCWSDSGPPTPPDQCGDGS